MTSAVAKNRRKALEKKVAEDAAKKYFNNQADKKLDKNERKLLLAQPVPGARRVSSGVLEATRKHQGGNT